MHSTDPAWPAPQSRRKPVGGSPLPFSPLAACARLRSCVQCATTWPELDEVARAIDAAFRGGEVDLAAAQDLTSLTVQAAAFLAPAPDLDHTVWAHELVDPAPGAACPCCGQQAWWWKEGGRVCGVCHPQPAWTGGEAMAHRAAA